MMFYEKNAVELETELCVVGGGMAGLCAAAAAARHGAKVVLMQDRPMLGGNASSEIRMWIRGAKGEENRETGILREIELENIYRNPTMNYSVWDTVLYQTVKNEPNITLLLNCSCLGCETEDGLIRRIEGWQLNTYTFFRVRARLFMDCSGDSILAPLSGAAYRSGREGRREFDEYGANEAPDEKTMGSSLLFQARETDHPCPFTAPDWAYRYPTDESMHLHSHELGPSGSNFWWIELSDGYDTLRDAQRINEELLKIVYGVWDHLKNTPGHGLENWELDWAGFLPGKRESRRYVGAYTLCQRDLEEGRRFDDAVAFGGWTMDNHDPLGFYHRGYSSRHIQAASPYQIPLRSLYSVNVPNLLFAGRNIGATHMALSSTRVMGTCAVMGQAAGVCAAVALQHGCWPDEAGRLHIRQIQRLLLEDGCFIPGLLRTPAPAAYSLSPAEAAILQNGWERPHGGAENTVAVPEGGGFSLSGSWAGGRLRLALDTDFSRRSVSDEPAYRKFAMRSHLSRDFKPLKMPGNLLRSGAVDFFSENGLLETAQIRENRRDILYLPVPPGTARIELRELRSWGGEEVRFFACDVTP